MAQKEKEKAKKAGTGDPQVLKLNALKEKLASVETEIAEHESTLRSLIRDEDAAEALRKEEAQKINDEIAEAEYLNHTDAVDTLRKKLAGLQKGPSLKIRGCRLTLFKACELRNALIAEITSLNSEGLKARLIPLIAPLNKAFADLAPLLKEYYSVCSLFDRGGQISKIVKLHPRLESATDGQSFEIKNNAQPFAFIQALPKLFLASDVDKPFLDREGNPRKVTLSDVSYFSIRECNLSLTEEKSALKKTQETKQK